MRPRARDAVRALGRLAGAYRAHRYAILFYTLLLTLAAAPLLTTLRFSGDALQIFLALNMLVALRGVPGRRRRAILVVLAVVVMAVRAAPASIVGAGLASAALLVGTGVALFAVAATIRFALGARAIGAEHIYAAMSAYMLAGLFFAVLYWQIALVWPGSFSEAGAAPSALTVSAAIYYSFVTLTTLGYGDVVPRTEVTRGLAVIEAVGGQLYIAVTIARLIGARQQPSGPPAH